MTESILARVKRVVVGGVGDMVDAFETAQGESVMREAVREVERAIDDARGEVGRIASKRMLATRQAAKIRAKAVEFTEKARLASSENRSDIAEALITRQVDLEAQVAAIENAIGEAQGEETELAQCLAALQERKREIDADLAAFFARRRVSPSANTKSADLARDARVEKASDAFDRVMISASDLAASASADNETASKVAEFEELLRQRKIFDRVNSLRAAP